MTGLVLSPWYEADCRVRQRGKRSSGGEMKSRILIWYDPIYIFATCLCCPSLDQICPQVFVMREQTYHTEPAIAMSDCAIIGTNGWLSFSMIRSVPEAIIVLLGPENNSVTWN